VSNEEPPAGKIKAHERNIRMSKNLSGKNLFIIKMEREGTFALPKSERLNRRFRRLSQAFASDIHPGDQRLLSRKRSIDRLRKVT